jgi:hypothetical protein
VAVVAIAVNRLDQQHNALVASWLVDALHSQSSLIDLLGALLFESAHAACGRRCVVDQRPDGPLDLTHRERAAQVHAVPEAEVLVKQPIDAVQVLRVLQQAAGSQQRVVCVPHLRVVRHVVVDDHIDVGAPAVVGSV